MEFQIEETLTWEDWDAWSKAHLLHGRALGRAARGAALFRRGVGALWMGLGGLLLLMGLLAGVWNLFTALGAVFLAAGVRWFRERDVRRAMSSRRAERALRANIPETPLRFTFDDGGFLVWESGRSDSFRYHALTDVWEDGDRYYLFLQGKMRYILRKDGFLRGTPAAFRQFLQARTGRPVETVL